MTQKFPESITGLSWRSTFKLAWNVTEQKSASGRRRALINQVYPSITFTESFPLLTTEKANKLLGFYNQMKGSYTPFYWKDHTLSNVVKQRLTGTAGAYPAVVPIGEWLEDTEYIEDVVVYVNDEEVANSKYSVSSGVIKFSTAPADTDVVTASYTAYFKVIFANELTATRIQTNVNKSGSINLEVVR